MRQYSYGGGRAGGGGWRLDFSNFMQGMQGGAFLGVLMYQATSMTDTFLFKTS